ncbi:MAG: 3-deoxy-manno-octulosonate cytidylyltransferase [Pseudobdellovibrionaceae bacterium]
MKCLGVIPARFASTRFPGKPLALILGKPLLQWVIEGSKTSKKLSEILVATDDLKIAELGKKCGVRVVMTDSELPTGTDRVWAAVKNENFDVVVNIQGDEPLISGSLLDSLVEPFIQNEIEMATLGRTMDSEALISETTAKIVMNQNDEALYFSRFPIPYSRNKNAESFSGCLKHIGMYAYRKNLLEKLCRTAPVEIEKGESLEQLRALYLGAKIKVVRVQSDSWGVDTPEDVSKIEKLLCTKGAK